MGYDMSFVTKPADGSEGYFRLNIWGMGRYCDLMFALGMVYNSESPGGWPEWNRFPDDEQKQGWFENAQDHLKYGEELDPQVPAEILEVAREHVAQDSAILRHHPAGGDTIPAHKFGSNDGWTVTSDEIKAALSVYDSCPGRDSWLLARLGSVESKAYWDKWIAYLWQAVDHDGFEVW